MIYGTVNARVLNDVSHFVAVMKNNLLYVLCSGQIGSLCHASLQTPTWIHIGKHVLVFNFHHQKVDLMKIIILCLCAL